MAKLKIASFNVRGLRNNRKCAKILHWCKLFTFDVLLLQETFLCTDSDYRYFKSQWEGPVFYSPSISSHSGGVAIAFSPMFNCNFSQVSSDYNGRLISVLGSFNNTSVRFCSVYAPNSPIDRKVFFRSIFKYTRGASPVILGGDFNCIVDNLDRSGDSSYCSTFTGRDELNDVVSSLNLVDSFRSVHPNDPGHTWFNPGKQLSSRLDRVYIPNSFSIEKVVTPSFPLSDHNPLHVYLQIPSSYSRGRGYWKFNTSLIQNVDFCDDLIFHYKCWATLKPAFSSISEWWDNVKLKIKDLSVRHGVRISRERRSRINNLHSSSPEEIDQLLDSDLKGVFTRSRVKSLEENEKPSAFFFRQEKHRAERKVVHSIRNSNGDIVTSHDDILNVFHNFYTNLFKEDVLVDVGLQNVLIDNLSNTISNESKDYLDYPISLAEVKRSIDMSANNKSPGCDGLPYEFYRDYIDLIGDDLVHVYNDIFMNGSLTESQRSSIITLLPKEGDAQDPGNRRPISLLNADYKILTKVLQLRLAKVLPDVVNDRQACSVPGRSIHDNLFIIRDVIDYSCMKDNPCAIISIDQHKAFDKVNWSFLFKVLEKMNFGANFRKWVKILYHNINSRILNNGFMSDFVSITRGVRQGCPLSPSLYVLFIEPLAQYIINSREIHGFTFPGSGGRSVKFLQYADDATCIATCISDVNNYFAAFKSFHRATGASVNMTKTHGLKRGSFSLRSLPGNIDWNTSSIRVTGIVFGTVRSVISHWQSKVDAAKSTLDAWRNRNLTLLGKVLVINTVIYTLFYYIAPVFAVPGSIIKTVNKLVFSFLWGLGKPDLVSRKVITLPRKAGGLGLDNFRHKLAALFVRPLFPLLTGQYPTHLLLPRFFVSKPLRSYFPVIWSNSRPNSDVCSQLLSFGCDIIKRLYLHDRDFISNCGSLKDIVSCLRPSDVTIVVIRDFPNFTWDEIWNCVTNNMLNNKLQDFQWRLSHRILHTKERIKRWGYGTGVCPVINCRHIESIYHLFLDCSNIRPVINWVERIFFRLTDSLFTFNKDFFLFGSPRLPGIPNIVFNRIWFIFCITKFVIWKSRCALVHESQPHSCTSILKSIIYRVKSRVETDFSRFSFIQFNSVWIDGKSFVNINANKLHFDL